MADLTDVCNVLVGLISGVVYPSGTGSASITGNSIRCFQGWPEPQQLDTDLRASIAQISVFPRQEEKTTTRYSKEWQQLTLNTATLATTINFNQITISGTIPPANNPHNVTVIINGVGYSYAVQVSDTLTTIASAVATLSGGSSSGAVITYATNVRIAASRIGVTGSAIREIRRQMRTFQITAWTNSPAVRDAIIQPLDIFLSNTPFLTMADGMAARMIYKGTTVSDELQKDLIYRRDLFYTVEYATTETQTQAQVGTLQLNETVNNGVTTTTVYQ